VHRQAVRRRGAERDQQVHVAAARAQRLPAGAVEARPEDELHRRGQHELHPARQHRVDAEELQQHRGQQRQREHRAGGHRPPLGQAPCRRRRGDLLRVVAGLVHGGGERGHRHLRRCLHGGPFGGEVHRRRGDTRHLHERLLDTRDARGARHAVDAKLDAVHGCQRRRCHDGKVKPLPGSSRLTFPQWQGPCCGRAFDPTEFPMIAFRVDDMSCGHCVSAITRAVKEADRDATVRVDLDTHRVEIEPAQADAQALAAAIEEAGYTPVAVAA
jgi:copper chaperone